MHASGDQSGVQRGDAPKLLPMPSPPAESRRDGPSLVRPSLPLSILELQENPRTAAFPRTATRARMDPVDRRENAVAMLVALFTLLSGLLNIYSVIGPSLPDRMESLRHHFPLEFIHLSRSAVLLIGYALVIISWNLYRSKRIAWWLAFCSTVASVAFHVTKGVDYEEATVSAALAMALLLARRRFVVRSRVEGWKPALARFAAMLGIVFGYGTIGFWLLEPHEFRADFSLLDSARLAFTFLTFGADPSVVAQTRYAAWFLGSLELSAAAAFLYFGYLVFRPAYYALRVHPAELQQARDIVEEHGRSSQDFFKTWPDKSLFFSRSRRSFLSYSVGNGFAVVFGDPVGPLEELPDLIEDFARFCRENDWPHAFHQATAQSLGLFERLGYRRFKIGDDAIVDLTQFQLSGNRAKHLRSNVNKLEKAGYTLTLIESPVADDILEEMKAVSDAWLSIPGNRERQFTLGRFDKRYLRDTRVLLVRDESGALQAFLNLIPSYAPGELTCDLMRRRPAATNGVMDYVFTKALLLAASEGYTRFNLGMAPMGGFQPGESASPEEIAIHRFFRRWNLGFRFQGLRDYKAKFAGFWEPRYLIYRSYLHLPRLALAIRQVSELPGPPAGTRKPRSRFYGTIRKWLPTAFTVFLVLWPHHLQAEESLRFEIRGKSQHVHLLRAQGPPNPEAVLFLPGDGGWLGRAVTMAQSIAALGYNVYALDTRAYLSDFTGTSTLTESQMASDLRTLAEWLQRTSGQPVVLAGWSQGANMALLGAAAWKDPRFCRGVLAIGLSDKAVLGWRFVDNLTYLTHDTPKEPTFSAWSHIGGLSPVPLAIVSSTHDEYIAPETTQKLLQAAREPKRLFQVDARNHRFDGNFDGFVQALRSSMEWIRAMNSVRGKP